MSYQNRAIEKIAFSPEFGRQMRFIAGPRQSGKTFMAKHFLQQQNSLGFYYNWDNDLVRRRMRENPHFFEEDLLKANLDSNTIPWLCFDEIHKITRWKNILKDCFDSFEEKFHFIVTGSARLDLFRKSGDSLAGRYFLFRINPLMLAEVNQALLTDLLPEPTAVGLIKKMLSHSRENVESFEQIFRTSGFPEPFLNSTELFNKKWHRDYLERVIREDIRDISNIQMIDKVQNLIYLLENKIASPLSINSLKADLELNFNTVRNYLKYLFLGYVLFEVPPYSKQVARLVRKEKKVYFYDWTRPKNEAARFENYVALELKSRLELWNDGSTDEFELFFVRLKTGKETDFLITKNQEPFFLCEVKLADTQIDSHQYHHQKLFNNIPLLQIIQTPSVLKALPNNVFVVSASRFFG